MDETVHLPAIDENTRTTNRMSARNRRTEILLRGERRRSWTADQKSQMVAESLGAELTPTEVARKHVSNRFQT
jgi:transposase-like protein